MVAATSQWFRLPTYTPWSGERSFPASPKAKYLSPTDVRLRTDRNQVASYHASRIGTAGVSLLFQEYIRMNATNFIVSTVAALSVVGAISVAYAQTTTPGTTTTPSVTVTTPPVTTTTPSVTVTTPPVTATTPEATRPAQTRPADTMSQRTSTGTPATPGMTRDGTFNERIARADRN
jgi:hypothetical protein